MKNIIFTADDFGWTKGVNEGIVLGYDHGPVSEISMAVNAPEIEHALSLISGKKYNIGIHLNLTKFKPISKYNISSLIDKKGNFKKIKTVDDVYEFLTMAKKSEIEKEIYAQFDYFKEIVGKRPTHISSHHGIHGDPKILDTVMEIAKEYKIPVRLPIWMSSKNGIISNYAAETLLKRSRIKTTNAIFMNIFNDDLRESPVPLMDEFLKVIDRMPKGTIEVICHIGFMDKDLLFSSSLNWQRVKDLIALLDPRLSRVLKDNRLTPVNWKGVVNRYKPERGIFHAEVDYMRR